MIEVSPFRIAPGESARLELRGTDTGRAQRLVLTRGPVRHAVLPLRTTPEAAYADWDVPGDAVQGLYTATVYGPGGYKRQRRNALMVLGREHHDGRFPAVLKYDADHFILDRDGIPMKDIGAGVGFARHPLVATYFIREHLASLRQERDEKHRRRVVDLCQWLLSQMSPHPSGAAMIRHPFPLQAYHLPAGWISGLTQGRVAEVFAEVWNLTGDGVYRDAAERTIKALAVPVEEGGLLARDALGWEAIEEYPSRPASWALNGIGSAVASLTMLSKVIPMDYAPALVERVCRSVDAKIPLFDVPGLPGSRVQLARRHRLTLSVAAASGNDPVSFSVNAAELQPWLEAPLAVEVPAAVAGEYRFDLLLGGNRDPFDAATPPETALVVDVALDQAARLRLSLADPDDGKPRLLGEAVAIAGRQRVRFAFDLHNLLPNGSGRIARFDEKYHNINLYWMFDLSLAGMLRPTYQTARRWLLSRLTGCGRVPFVLSEGQRLAIAAGRIEFEQELASFRPDALEQGRRPAYLAGTKAFDELLGLGARAALLELSHMVPRRCRAGAREIRIFGFGFTPQTAFRMRDAATGAPLPLAADVIASDEAVLAVDTLGCAGRAFELWAESGDGRRSRAERLDVV